MTWNNPDWKPKNGITNMPYIEGCITQDYIMFQIGNKKQNRSIFIFLHTAEAKTFIESIQEARDENERVKGIRSQKHTMRWQ